MFGETPVLVNPGPGTLQWSVNPMQPETAQVEYSTDGVTWTIHDTVPWGDDSDIFTSGYYRMLGLINGHPATQYSNVLHL